MSAGAGMRVVGYTVGPNVPYDSERVSGPARGGPWPWSHNPRRYWIFATRDDAVAWIALRELAPAYYRIRRVVKRERARRGSK